jgi:hypothetical protein
MFEDYVVGNYSERKLGIVGKLVPKLRNPSAHNRSPMIAIPKVRDADVLFISQIYNVKPELKHNTELSRPEKS